MECVHITCPSCSTVNRFKPSAPGIVLVCGNCRKRLPGQSDKIDWLFAATIVTFLLGIFLPLMTVSKHVTKMGIELVNAENTVSLVSGLQALLQDDKWGMFCLLLFFSIVFPIAKLTLCFLMWRAPLQPSTRLKISHLLYHTGKWSMLDVFVVGILVVAVELQEVAKVEMHSGVFWFAASVGLSIWLTSSLAKTKETNA